MRRFMVIVEVTDSGEPDKDGAPLYTLRSAAQAGRWLKQHVTVAGSAVNTIGISVRLSEEMLP